MNPDEHRGVLRDAIRLNPIRGQKAPPRPSYRFASPTGHPTESSPPHSSGTCVSGHRREWRGKCGQDTTKGNMQLPGHCVRLAYFGSAAKCWLQQDSTGPESVPDKNAAKEKRKERNGMSGRKKPRIGDVTTVEAEAVPDSQSATSKKSPFSETVEETSCCQFPAP